MIDTNQLIADAIQRIVAGFQPDRIILFGSHVRGDATFDSDVDLMVIMQVEGSVRKKTNEIDLALSDRTIPLDLIVLTPEMFQQQKTAPGGIVRQAIAEGKVVYEHAA